MEIRPAFSRVLTDTARSGFLALVILNAGCEASSPNAPTPQAELFRVTSVSPAVGRHDQPVFLTILGTGFLTGATVNVGGNAATGTTVHNSTRITATAPAHDVGPVDVVVTNPGGESARLGQSFTYLESTYVLRPSAETVVAGEPISVFWSAPVGFDDWIGLFRVGQPNTAYVEGLWRYTSGASGTMTFMAPAVPGEYEFRYLPNDGYVDAARSKPVTVTPK